MPHGVERVHRLDRLDRRLAVLDHVVHEQVLVRRGPRAPRTTCPAWTTTPLDLISHGKRCNEIALIAVVGTLWLGLAGIIVATATGHTDISPLSGLALIVPELI